MAPRRAQNVPRRDSTRPTRGLRVTGPRGAVTIRRPSKGSDRPTKGSDSALEGLRVTGPRGAATIRRSTKGPERPTKGFNSALEGLRLTGPRGAVSMCRSTKGSKRPAKRSCLGPRGATRDQPARGRFGINEPPGGGPQRPTKGNRIGSRGATANRPPAKDRRRRGSDPSHEGGVGPALEGNRHFRPTRGISDSPAHGLIADAPGKRWDRPSKGNAHTARLLAMGLLEPRR